MSSIEWRSLPEPMHVRAIDAARSVLNRLGHIDTYIDRQLSLITRHPRTNQEIAHLSQNHPEVFARDYFVKNVTKCAIAAEIYRSEFRNFRRVVDLGTGPGTFLFPFAFKLKNNEFVGVDISGGALRLAESLFRECQLPIPLLIQGHVPYSLVAGGRFFTASYLVTELDHQDWANFVRWMSRRLDAQFLIVDYPDVVARLASAVSNVRPCTSYMLKLQLPRDLASMVGDDEITFGAAYAPVTGSSDAALSRELGQPRYSKAHGSF